MFVPAYYRNDDIQEIKSFIRQYSFAILVTNNVESPLATHIPVELMMNKYMKKLNDVNAGLVATEMMKHGIKY